MPYNDDPFSGGSRTPSLSWKDVPVGEVFTLRILEPAKLLQSRNFESNEPDFWDAAKTQPKMSAVVNVEVLSGPHSVGEERSVWAQKPSNLFAAIATAQKQAGAVLTEGGTLHIKFVGTTPHTNPRYSPIKNYAAKYDPPAAADVFQDTPPAQPPGMRTWGSPGPSSPMAPAQAPLPGTTPRPAYNQDIPF